MHQILKILENFVFNRSCCLCGAFDANYQIICNFCWRNLLAHFQNENNRTVGSIEVTALFSWIPGAGKDLGQLLYCFKQLNSRAVWRLVAEEWIRRAKINRNDELRSKTILVPIPSPSGRIQAELFAAALSELTGFPVHSILGFNKRHMSFHNQKTEQKYLNRKQREKRRFIMAEEFTKISYEEVRIIFVDDVITTGSTARAAASAVGAVKAELWCLADRRQLATSS